MTHPVNRVGRAVAAAGFLAILAGTGGAAQTMAPAAPTGPGAATPPPQSSVQQPPPARESGLPAHPDERTEARIRDLHQRLHITAAQEQQFQSFAEVMRSNAQAMDGVLEQLAHNPNMNAVDDLRSYGEITAAHADALKKLLSAFEPLYSSLSPEQRKMADTLFAQSHRREQHHIAQHAG